MPSLVSWLMSWWFLLLWEIKTFNCSVGVALNKNGHEMSEDSHGMGEQAWTEQGSRQKKLFKRGSFKHLTAFLWLLLHQFSDTWYSLSPVISKPHTQRLHFLVLSQA